MRHHSVVLNAHPYIVDGVPDQFGVSRCHPEASGTLTLEFRKYLDRHPEDFRRIKKVSDRLPEVTAATTAGNPEESGNKEPVGVFSGDYLPEAPQESFR